MIRTREISSKHLPTPKLERQQYVDSGMVLILISLILYLYLRNETIVRLTIILVILNMTVPAVFKPFAKIWFGLSARLGAISSVIILTILYYGIIAPVGIARRYRGKDPLQLRRWKTGVDSVFTKRDHTITKENLEKPY